MLLSHFQKGLVEAGIDEAGRGCYAGPVFAAAVVLPPDFHHPAAFVLAFDPAEHLAREAGG